MPVTVHSDGTDTHITFHPHPPTDLSPTLPPPLLAQHNDSNKCLFNSLAVMFYQSLQLRSIAAEAVRAAAGEGREEEHELHVMGLQWLHTYTSLMGLMEFDPLAWRAMLAQYEAFLRKLSVIPEVNLTRKTRKGKPLALARSKNPSALSLPYTSAEVDSSEVIPRILGPAAQFNVATMTRRAFVLHTADGPLHFCGDTMEVTPLFSMMAAPAQGDAPSEGDVLELRSHGELAFLFAKHAHWNAKDVWQWPAICATLGSHTLAVLDAGDVVALQGLINAAREGLAPEQVEGERNKDGVVDLDLFRYSAEEVLKGWGEQPPSLEQRARISATPWASSKKEWDALGVTRAQSLTLFYSGILVVPLRTKKIMVVPWTAREVEQVQSVLALAMEEVKGGASSSLGRGDDVRTFPDFGGGLYTPLRAPARVFGVMRGTGVHWTAYVPRGEGGWWLVDDQATDVASKETHPVPLQDVKALPEWDVGGMPSYIIWSEIKIST